MFLILLYLYLFDIQFFDFIKRMFLDSDFIMLLIGQPELEEFHLLLGINLVRTVFLPLLWFAF